jgi:hypothetical protein
MTEAGTNGTNVGFTGKEETVVSSPIQQQRSVEGDAFHGDGESGQDLAHQLRVEKVYRKLDMRIIPGKSHLP